MVIRSPVGRDPRQSAWETEDIDGGGQGAPKVDVPLSAHRGAVATPSAPPLSDNNALLAIDSVERSRSLRGDNDIVFADDGIDMYGSLRNYPSQV